MTVGVAAWLLAVALAWIVAHARVGPWARRWRLAPTGEPLGAVRVVVPARDEAGTVGACVEATLGSRGVDLELVVVDDGSTDATAREAEGAARGDVRVRVLPLDDRPARWSGKAWACARGAEGSICPWLCFVDADVRLAPETLAAAVARAERDGATLLSLFGTWELRTLVARVAQPAIGWAVRGSVDVDAVNEGGREAPAFANGQVLLVRRDRYEALGGHGGVRGTVLEDVALAVRFRAAGEPLRLLWAPWAFRVGAYRTVGEIVRGYGKNLYEGLGRDRGAVVGLIVGLLLASVGPAALVPIAIASGAWPVLALAAGVTALSIGLRYRLERRDGRSGAIAVLHPVADVILVVALLWSVSRRRVRWKGREFVDGQAS